jgi:hypothetical protein
MVPEAVPVDAPVELAAAALPVPLVSADELSRSVTVSLSGATVGVSVVMRAKAATMTTSGA